MIDIRPVNIFQGISLFQFIYVRRTDSHFIISSIICYIDQYQFLILIQTPLFWFGFITYFYFLWIIEPKC